MGSWSFAGRPPWEVSSELTAAAHPSLGDSDRSKIGRSVVRQVSIYMVELLGYFPSVHVKIYELVPTHKLAQDVNLPSSGVAQRACWPVFQSQPALRFNPSEELAGLVIEIETLRR